ncbi:hypothetical protein D3C80_623390 [compost metagenome]
MGLHLGEGILEVGQGQLVGIPGRRLGSALGLRRFESELGQHVIDIILAIGVVASGVGGRLVEVGLEIAEIKVGEGPIALASALRLAEIGLEIGIQLGKQGRLQLLLAHDLVAGPGLGLGLAGEIQLRGQGQTEVSLVGQVELGHQIRIPVGRRHRRLHIEGGQGHLIIAEDDVSRGLGPLLAAIATRLIEIRHGVHGLVIGDADRHQLVKLAALLPHHHGGGLRQALLLLFQLAAGAGPQPERHQRQHQQHGQQDDHGEVQRRGEQLHHPVLLGFGGHHGRHRLGLELRHLFLQRGLILQLGLEGLHLFGQGLQAQLEPVVHLGDLTELGVGIFQRQRHLGGGFAHHGRGTDRQGGRGSGRRGGTRHRDCSLGDRRHLGRRLGRAHLGGGRRKGGRLGHGLDRRAGRRLGRHRMGLLLGQVFGAQPLPAGVVAVEAATGLGVRDAARLGGAGQQNAGSHQDVVDVAVGKTTGILVIDRHHGLVDGHPVGGAMLARQAPEGIGGTNRAIAARRRAGRLTHYGLSPGSRLGRRHGLGLRLNDRRRGTVRALELDKERLSPRLIGLSRAQKTQCE